MHQTSRVLKSNYSLLCMLLAVVAIFAGIWALKVSNDNTQHAYDYIYCRSETMLSLLIISGALFIVTGTLDIIQLILSQTKCLALLISLCQYVTLISYLVNIAVLCTMSVFYSQTIPRSCLYRSVKIADALGPFVIVLWLVLGCRLAIFVLHFFSNIFATAVEQDAQQMSKSKQKADYDSVQLEDAEEMNENNDEDTDDEDQDAENNKSGKDEKEIAENKV